MRTIVIFLTLLALAAAFKFDAIERANTHQRSISSQIVEAIEKFRDQMPCGFPQWGIPPLAPLEVAHKELSLTALGMNLTAEADDIVLNGLNNFDIAEFKFSPVLSKFMFKFHWTNVNLTTQYKVQAANSNLKRAGSAFFAIKDILVWGELKYAGALAGKFRVKHFYVYISIGDVKSQIENLSNIGIVNRKLNEIIEEFVMLTVNDNTNNIPVFTDGVLVPIMNDLIGDRTLRELVAIIKGGKGGKGGSNESGDGAVSSKEAEEPTQPCLPPTKSEDL